jgi:hypothetical protein
MARLSHKALHHARQCSIIAFMQDAQLTVRLPADLKDQIQERAAAESKRGTRVTMANVVVRTMAQAAKRWGNNGQA